MCFPNTRRGVMKHRWNFAGPMMCCCSPDTMTKKERIDYLKEYRKDLEDEIKDVERKICQVEGEK